jgi:hypothetical protein
MITAHDKWKCAERELAMRRRVYPKQITAGRLTMREARYEIDLMAAIAEDYRQLAEVEDKEGTLL